MSYYIAHSLTITPDKIYSYGCDNNVFPRTPEEHILENNQFELRAITKDLISGSIQPLQEFWKRVKTKLQHYYTYEQVNKDNAMLDEAVNLMRFYYNQKIVENYDHMKQRNPNLKLQLI